MLTSTHKIEPRRLAMLAASKQVKPSPQLRSQAKEMSVLQSWNSQELWYSLSIQTTKAAWILPTSCKKQEANVINASTSDSRPPIQANDTCGQSSPETHGLTGDTSRNCTEAADLWVSLEHHGRPHERLVGNLHFGLWKASKTSESESLSLEIVAMPLLHGKVTMVSYLPRSCKTLGSNNATK